MPGSAHLRVLLVLIAECNNRNCHRLGWVPGVIIFDELFFLLRLFDPLTLAQANARTPAILVDEFDPCFLESSDDFVSG